MKDWATLDVCTVRCRCGACFRAKHQIEYEKRLGIIDRDCPGCGKRDDVWNASYDVERWQI